MISALRFQRVLACSALLIHEKGGRARRHPMAGVPARLGLRRPHPAQRSRRLRTAPRACFPKIWGRKLGCGDSISRANGATPSVVAYTYWPTGRVKTLTDPDNRVSRYDYDVANRLTFTTDPELRRTLKLYNAASEVILPFVYCAAADLTAVVSLTSNWSSTNAQFAN